MKKFLLAAVVITLFMTTSCTDNDDNPTPIPTEMTELPTEQTEDALAVKYGGNHVVYGELNDGIAAALQRRMQDTMTSPMDADCFVINPTGLGQLDMSMEEWKNLVRKIDTGEASVVLTQCSFINFYNFVTAYISTSLYMEQENYQGDPDTEAQARKQASRRMAGIVRNAYMAGGQADGAMTRGTEVNGQELDWAHIDQWPKEKQMATMFDAYALCGGNEIYVLNAEASIYLNEEVPEQPDNDYEWGQKADAIADWLNRQRKDDAETRAGLADFTRAVTRAGGSTAIKDLMDAQTKEFVFDYKYPSLFNTSVESAYSAIKVQYSVYGAYDFSGNVEYYQVRQNITVMNDKLFIDPGDGWWPRSNDGRWTLARGAYMKRIDTKMWLEGSGTKSIVSAAPLNENGSSSGSSTTGGSSATTDGWSTSSGFSAGVSVGFMTAEINASYNYAHTKDHSTTNEISWNTSTNWSTKDLTTIFTQGNDANGTVTWKHTGNTPTNGNDAHVSKLKPLLRSTCVTDEQTLWKVENPSGTYTLKANVNVVAEIYKIAWNGSGYDGNLPTQDNPHEISFDLIAPNRYKVKWNNVIYDYGTKPDDMSMIEYSEYIDRFIEKTYGSGSANFCWAGLFTSTEATADGSENARAVFQTFKNSIRGMKQQLRAKGVKGRIVFGLKHDGVEDEELVDQIILVLDGTGYNEGDTFTEKLNGFNLTYKVMKKDEEVMLYEVRDFSGELNIPATVNEGFFKVTSIGKDAILGCNKTSSISIPEGVTSIEAFGIRLCHGCTDIYLPSTLEICGDHALTNNYHLQNVHIKASTPPTMGIDVFSFCREIKTLYIPKGCKDAYASAKEWKNFKNIVEE